MFVHVFCAVSSEPTYSDPNRMLKVSDIFKERVSIARWGFQPYSLESSPITRSTNTPRWELHLRVFKLNYELETVVLSLFN